MEDLPSRRNQYQLKKETMTKKNYTIFNKKHFCSYLYICFCIFKNRILIFIIFENTSFYTFEIRNHFKKFQFGYLKSIFLINHNENVTIFNNDIKLLIVYIKILNFTKLFSIVYLLYIYFLN